jgi:hypothetical protein
LNNSQELVLILGSSTWSAATAYHSSSKIVILCHALLCALEPGGCTWFKIHVSCKCSGSYDGTAEVGSPFIWAVLLHHWVIGVCLFKTMWWLSCQGLCLSDPWRRNHCNVYKCWTQVTHRCSATSHITCLAILNNVFHIFNRQCPFMFLQRNISKNN